MIRLIQARANKFRHARIGNDEFFEAVFFRIKHGREQRAGIRNDSTTRLENNFEAGLIEDRQHSADKFAERWHIFALFAQVVFRQQWMTNDVAVMNSLPAAEIQVFQYNARFDAQGIYKFYRGARRLDKRIERRNLRTDVNVYSNDFQSGMLRSIDKSLSRVRHIDAKFILLHPGRNIGMALR